MTYVWAVGSIRHPACVTMAVSSCIATKRAAEAGCTSGTGVAGDTRVRV